jgi:hypothetical protein
MSRRRLPWILATIAASALLSFGALHGCKDEDVPP